VWFLSTRGEIVWRPCWMNTHEQLTHSSFQVHVTQPALQRAGPGGPGAGYTTTSSLSCTLRHCWIRSGMQLQVRCLYVVSGDYL
jgi:hypothetical protein